MVMEFRFNTDMETARRVMTSWNMAVMQSMAADPEKLNMISSFIQGSMHGAPGGGGGGASERGGKASSLHRGIFGSSTKQKSKPAPEKDTQGQLLYLLHVHLSSLLCLHEYVSVFH